MICIMDRGPGIPKLERNRVMEKFEQVGDLMTSKPQGLGLGLPLVREILTAHGGSLVIECPEEGGTVVQARIPFRPIEASPAEPEPAVLELTEGVMQ